MYKYDTHVHSSDGSACASNDSKAIVEKYAEMNYSGIILTNHFFNGNTCIPHTYPYEFKVELFVSSYETAKKHGKNLGLDVFFGWEYSLHSADVLTYGLDEDFLLAHPEICEISFAEYVVLVRQNGGMLIHAHPFREMGGDLKFVSLGKMIDGVEVYNSAQLGTGLNEKAYTYAFENNLPMTAGSDAHSVNHEFFSGMLFKSKLSDIHDFISRVKGSQQAGLIIKN